MLMHADYGGVDHLDSGIVGRGKCVYDEAPDTSSPPADEAVVARGVWAKRLGQITPGCSRSQDPEDAIEDTTVVYPRNATRLVGQHRGGQSMSAPGYFRHQLVMGLFAVIAADESDRNG
jgi:hypothetical protein